MCAKTCFASGFVGIIILCCLRWIYFCRCLFLPRSSDPLPGSCGIFHVTRTHCAAFRYCCSRVVFTLSFAIVVFQIVRFRRFEGFLPLSGSRNVHYRGFSVAFSLPTITTVVESRFCGLRRERQLMHLLDFIMTTESSSISLLFCSENNATCRLLFQENDGKKIEASDWIISTGLSENKAAFFVSKKASSVDAVTVFITK